MANKQEITVLHPDTALNNSNKLISAVVDEFLQERYSNKNTLQSYYHYIMDFMKFAQAEKLEEL